MDGPKGTDMEERLCQKISELEKKLRNSIENEKMKIKSLGEKIDGSGLFYLSGEMS